MENSLTAKSTSAPAPVKTNIEIIRDLYSQRKTEIAKILNDVIAPDKLFMVAMTHVRKNPLLAQCEPMSFVNALVESVQLGLDLNPAYGYAYLIPRRKDKKLFVEFQLGYRGLIELANRSGKIDDIYAQIVYSNEEFAVEYGLNPKLHHKPKSPSERGEIIGAYAVARLKSGVVKYEYIWKEEIEKIKKKSDSLKGENAKYSPWNTSEDEMIKKTAVRRLAKWLPLSSKLLEASITDEYREAGIELKDAEDIIPNFEMAKSMLEDSRTLEDLREVWKHIYKNLKPNFSNGEIEKLEEIKNALKEKIEKNKETEKENAEEEESTNSENNKEMEIIVAEFKEAQSEKDITTIWKSHMSYISKLQKAKLEFLIDLKKNHIERIKNNANNGEFDF